MYVLWIKPRFSRRVVSDLQSQQHLFMKIPEPAPPMTHFLLIASLPHKQLLPWIVGNRLVQRLWYRFLSWLISNTFSHSFTVIWFLMLSAVCSSSLSSFPPNWEVEEKQNEKSIIKSQDNVKEKKFHDNEIAGEVKVEPQASVNEDMSGEENKGCYCLCFSDMKMKMYLSKGLYQVCHLSQSHY